MVSEIFGYDHLDVLLGPRAAYYITEGACACLISRQPGSKKKGGEKKGALTFNDMSSDLNSFP